MAVMTALRLTVTRGALVAGASHAQYWWRFIDWLAVRLRVTVLAQMAEAVMAVRR